MSTTYKSSDVIASLMEFLEKKYKSIYFNLVQKMIKQYLLLCQDLRRKKLILVKNQCYH